ncbi:MAG: HAD superfamily hydrolase (TIGR01490 family) [Rubritalea sp.]|jgi:HAD superfamily hydrolase (TIGR01490 family)
MNESTKSGYALFDLDQTIIPWDTQLLFCNFVLKREPLRRLHILGLIPFLPFTKILGAGGMKRVFLNYLALMEVETLDQYAREFVDEIFPSEMYTEVLEIVREQREAGRVTILNSASPEVWVKYLAEKMEFDHCYGTRVEIGKRVQFFPDIIGGNNKGAVKLGRMKPHFPADWKDGEVLENSYGYSDSHADIPMLEICEHNTMVHPTDKLLEHGKKLGWQKLTPSRPTNGKLSFAWACCKQSVGLYKP